MIFALTAIELKLVMQSQLNLRLHSKKMISINTNGNKKTSQATLNLVLILSDQINSNSSPD